MTKKNRLSENKWDVRKKNEAEMVTNMNYTLFCVKNTKFTISAIHNFSCIYIHLSEFESKNKCLLQRYLTSNISTNMCYFILHMMSLFYVECIS